MTAKIEELILPQSIEDNFIAEVPFNSLRRIRRLNVLIGPNNSGKSRLLRALFQSKNDLLVSTDEETPSKIRLHIRIALQQIAKLEAETTQFTRHLTAAKESLTVASYSFAALKNIVFGGDVRQADTGGILKVANDIQNDHAIRYSPEHKEMFRGLQSELQNVNSLVQQMAKSPRTQYQQQNDPKPKPQFHDAQFVYIPTLRGMRVPFNSDESKYTYFDRTVKDYFPKLVNRDSDLSTARNQFSGTEIVTGLDLFELVSDKLLGSLADRQFIRNFEEFLSKSFFDSKPIALIPRKGRDTLHIKIGDEEERAVESLGDGIQQIVILTLPIFLNRNRPLFLFIEEPDLFLHPGFQQVLIDLITASENENFYAFVTTHSPQFVDITLSEELCSIFRCEKRLDREEKNDLGEVKAKFRVEGIGHGDNSILRHVGVRPSSLMFANCTIWVEGITDRLYFRKYLALEFAERDLKYVENLHFAFVEYGGGNITHWSFLDEEGMDVDRICASLFLICDQDEGKEERHEQLSKVLGDRFYKLDVKEVENLLTPEVITAVIQSYEGEDFKIESFNQTAYANRFLGRFIDNKILPDKTKSKRYGKLETCYEDKSGTVKAKGEFCRRAIANIEVFDDMSEEAKKLASSLCDFIVDQNQI